MDDQKPPTTLSGTHSGPEGHDRRTSVELRHAPPAKPETGTVVSAEPEPAIPEAVPDAPATPLTAVDQGAAENETAVEQQPKAPDAV